MSEQADKIIRLAREMLRDNNDNVTFRDDGKAVKRLTGIKVAAFTALLAAFGSASLTHMIDEMRRPINRYERVEIEALIFYAAREQARSIHDIQNEIEQDLALSSINGISAADYRRIRDYLRKKIKS